jgi:hypothetical protein
VSALVHVAASTLGTVVTGLYIWHRRAEWRERRFNRDDQLVIVFIAVALANAAISYAYTKDVILSPAGAFFAVAVTIAVRHLIDRAPRTIGRQTAAAGLLLALSCTWAFCAVGTHLMMRKWGNDVRNEWAYVDDWLVSQGLVSTSPFALEMKRQLQDDAIVRHPARTAIMGDWVEWFAE